jgi:cysteine desulfurase
MSAYLDWAATTPPDPDILAESMNIALRAYGNPSSVHAAGKEAASILAEARERCAKALGVKAEKIVFTSGGSEADQFPLLSLLQRPVRGTIAVSAIEHPAILEQAKMLEPLGWKTLKIPVNRDGFVTVESVLDTIRDDTALVAVMAVNNETGAIQPVKEIAAALKERAAGKKKPHFHVDAVQATGKIPLALAGSGIDSAAISAHKLKGPRGIGLLYLDHRVEPFIRGGGQEGGLRPGTENLAGAWALSRVLEKNIAEIADSRTTETMAHLIEAITALDGIAILPESRTARDPRFSPYVAQFSNRSIPGEVLVRALSDRGVFISTGSACSSRKKTRPVLEAMHIAPDAQRNAFRVSIGPDTGDADVEALVRELSGVLQSY